MILTVCSDSGVEIIPLSERILQLFSAYICCGRCMFIVLRRSSSPRRKSESQRSFLNLQRALHHNNILTLSLIPHGMNHVNNEYCRKLLSLRCAWTVESKCFHFQNQSYYFPLLVSVVDDVCSLPFFSLVCGMQELMFLL